MERLGPLHGWSMYLFERQMHHVGTLVKNPRYKEGSIAHNYAIEKGAERASMLRSTMLIGECGLIYI